MILDELFEFADATALNTGGAASYLVGDVVDLGASPTLKDIGIGADVWVVIDVDTTATSGGSATGQFHLCSDAQAAIAVDGSATYHFSTSAIPVATLVAGYRIAAFRLPAGIRYERYLGIVQTTAVAAFTAGKINAYLTKDFAEWTSFPNPVGA